jgi:beta-glucosidase
VGVKSGQPDCKSTNVLLETLLNGENYMPNLINQMISKMTLEEKVSLLAGADSWRTPPIERLGIPVLKVSDGPNGVRGDRENPALTSACFPCGTALAATWNLELVEKIGEALGEELETKAAHVLLAPTVNIHRSPISGRNFECHSEDPFLSGFMATAYIRGVQSKGVGACIKHFVCNDQEFERKSISSEVDERTLHEIYLTPFRIAIQLAQPWALMTAYNRVNGVYACENKYLLNDILKGDWGYDGYVISDWYGTYGPETPKYGLDLEMPGTARWMGENVLELVRAGELEESVVDDKVRRLLLILQRVNAFSSDSKTRIEEYSLDKPEHRAVARKAAAEAIVLLKNENNLLPLEPKKFKSIAVIGYDAKAARILGGGSAWVNAHYITSPYDALVERYGDKFKITYRPGCYTFKKTPPIETVNLITPEERPGMQAVYYDNYDLEGDPIHSEVALKSELSWFGQEGYAFDLTRFSLRMSGRYTPSISGMHRFRLSGQGRFRLILDGERKIEYWPDTSPLTIEDGFQDDIYYDMELEASKSYDLVVEYSCVRESQWRGVHLGAIPLLPDTAFEDAVALAKESDVAIVFAGLNLEWESEGFDRSDMRLPMQQDDLIERISRVNPNTVVVLTAGSPLEMPWIGDVSSVLQAWYLGQEVGNAIGDIIFGEVNPSGKLPQTFPVRLEDNPAYINYPGENGKVRYGEGIFVGYRYYDEKKIIPLFPFGYGLSYTTFEYSSLSVVRDKIKPGEILEVSVTVTNTGDRPGKEVVQVYVRDAQSRLIRPEKELKGFRKIMLQPGESKVVDFKLTADHLAYYDPAISSWIAEKGEYEVLIGSSSQDIHLQQGFYLESEVRKKIPDYS